MSYQSQHSPDQEADQETDQNQARPEQSRAFADGNHIKEYIIDMIWGESQIYNSNDAEQAEQSRARHI